MFSPIMLSKPSVTCSSLDALACPICVRREEKRRKRERERERERERGREEGREREPERGHRLGCFLHSDK